MLCTGWLVERPVHSLSPDSRFSFCQACDSDAAHAHSASTVRYKTECK